MILKYSTIIVGLLTTLLSLTSGSDVKSCSAASQRYNTALVRISLLFLSTYLNGSYSIVLLQEISDRFTLPPASKTLNEHS